MREKNRADQLGGCGARSILASDADPDRGRGTQEGRRPKRFTKATVERSVLFKPSTAFRVGGQVTGSHLAFVCGKRS